MLNLLKLLKYFKKDSKIHNNSQTNIKIILGEATMTIDDIKKIEKGSVIKLNTVPDDYFKIKNDNNEIFEGYLTVDDESNFNFKIKRILCEKNSI